MWNRVIVLIIFWVVLGGSLETSSQAATTKEPGNHEYTLEEVIQLALEQNPVMAVGEGVIEEKQGQHLVASAYPNPSVDVLLGHSEFRDSEDKIVTFERHVTLNQPLEWSPKRVARQRAAKAGVEGAHAALAEAKLKLKADVKEAFYALLLVGKRAKLASQNLAIVENLSRAVKSRVRAGEAPPFEEVKVNVEVLKVTKEVTRAESAVHAARASLNTLTAGELGQVFAISGDFASWPKKLKLERVEAYALERHPSLKKLGLFVEQAKQSYIQERQARVPNLTVSGSYQRDAGREAYLGGLSIPLPLWYQRQGEIAKALGTRRQIEGELFRTKNTIINDVTQSFQISQAASAQIATFEQGLLKQAREAVRIAQVSFRYGESSLLEVIDAQRVLWQTLVAYAQARFDLSIALTRLERSVGGVPWRRVTSAN